ncbi:MAG TPA: enolase C-terminal domain-like protein [Myxococcaceae bacterium]|nr:enolase C-terminal domain-like protein [Myxococcaceae bacterium]
MADQRIERLEVRVFSVPTDSPESDGTARWDHTVLVLVEAHGAGEVGIGYTYTARAAGTLIRDDLRPCALGADLHSPSGVFQAMGRRLRNLGRRGLGWMALSAVDAALWDLNARVLRLPLSVLLGAVRPAVPVYGSGGFTSYTVDQLQSQLGGWVAAGIPRVKMKVGTDPAADPARVHAARQAIGPAAELFVDANGAYDRKQALAKAQAFAHDAVTWFEEPVSSEDVAGLRLVRDGLPPGMEVAAGEYASDPDSLRPLLEVVDVLQADMTRCGGVTGLLGVAALCEAWHLPLSLHCAPAQHVPVAVALRPLRHLEYFHDHVRIERMFFDGVAPLVGGAMVPGAEPGNGLVLREKDAKRFEV